MGGILEKMTNWLFGKDEDCNHQPPECESYKHFRKEIHESRNTTFEAIGAAYREKQAAEKMRQISEEAISTMERQRDGDGQATNHRE